MENITYPVIYGVEGKEHYVSFEDDNLIDISGDSINNVVAEAKEVLGLHLVDLYEKNENIIVPNESDFKIADNEKIIYLDIWLPYYLSSVKNEYKKKTLTIPTWLDLLARRKNLNFSQILVKGLKIELGLE